MDFIMSRIRLVFCLPNLPWLPYLFIPEAFLDVLSLDSTLQLDQIFRSYLFPTLSAGTWASVSLCSLAKSLFHLPHSHTHSQFVELLSPGSPHSQEKKSATGGQTKKSEAHAGSDRNYFYSDFRKPVSFASNFSTILLISGLTGCSLLLKGIVIHQCACVLISWWRDRKEGRIRLQSAL